MKSIYFFLWFIFISFTSQAQLFVSSENSNLSVGLGSTSYFGELSPYRTFYRGVFKTLDCNLNLSYNQLLSERWGNKIDFEISKLRGDDFSYSKNFNKGNFHRNLHFKNTLYEVAFSKVFSFNPNYSLQTRRRPEVNMYVNFGLGLFYHNPVARNTSATVEFKDDWVKLRKWGVAGVNYSLIQPFVPLGFGFQKKLSRKIDMKVEGLYKFTFTDYLDDVSNESFLTSIQMSSTQAFALHNRSTELRDGLHNHDRLPLLKKYNLVNADGSIMELTGERGVRNVLSSFDSFITSQIGLVYWLDKRIR